MRFLPLTALYSLLAFGALPATEFHVSPQGNDANAGTEPAPFATLSKARDAIRKLRADQHNENMTIFVHDGTYEMTEPLVLDSKDSDLVIEAAKGSKPVFLGSRKVEGFGAYKGLILKADVSDLGLGKLHVRQLLFDGERQPLARYPNYDPQNPLYGGWAFIQDIPKEKEEGHKWKSECYLSEKDVRHWDHPEDVEMNVFAMYGWWNFILPVKGIDGASRKLSLAKDCGYDLHPHNRFMFQNALEEIDSPGEWYLDRRTQTLYFWPPKSLEGHEVRVPVIDSFIRIRPGANRIGITGLGFHGSIGTALIVENGESCFVSNCQISHCGGFSGAGISINGKNNHVTWCEIFDIGSTGVSVNGGDRITLTSANNTVENCRIHHVGVINKNGAGVGLNGCGNIVSHNLIHDCPRMGVQFGGNNLAIEYNHIHHTVLETQDGGALYTGGRDWISSRGSRIRYNFIHDTVGVGQEAKGLKIPWFTWGIYMDDNTGGVNIIGNIVARSSRASLHLHNARDCVVRNNIFVDGGEKQLEYDGWSREQHYIVDHMDTMVKGWESVKDQPAWANMRGMKVDPRDAFFPDGTMMSGDVIERNIVVWHDPSLRYVDFRYFTSAHNVSDYNLIWNGRHPIRTAVSKVGKDTGDDLLAGSGSLTAADEGKTPKGWGWNHKPRKELRLQVQDGSLMVDAAMSDDPKVPHSTIHGPNIVIKPGSAYRARLKMKASEPGMQVDCSFGVFENGKGYWQTRSQTTKLTQEWQEIEVTGTMPKPGETSYKEWMKNFWLRVDVRADKGSVMLKDVTIREAEPMDEWLSWQSDGWDQHSVIADPLFQDESKDDYRLKKDSPARSLKFEPIPVEKIGPQPRLPMN
jgi:parallel beta-helix repeat protein